MDTAPRSPVPPEPGTRSTTVETISGQPVGTVASTTDTQTTVTQMQPPPSWLHTNLRNLVTIAFVGMTLWLAWVDAPHAREAVVVTATSLVSYLFGERTALRTPGKDGANS